MGEVRIWDFAWAVRRGREGEEGVVERSVARRVGEGRGKDADVRACFSWVVRVRSIASFGCCSVRIGLLFALQIVLVMSERWW